MCLMNEKRRIKVSAYNPCWKSMYESEADRLTEVFSPSLIALHHIGSTAVPSLFAKPTIDIAVEVRRTARIPDFYPAMERLGYTCRGECLDAVIPGTPGRFYFVLYKGVDHIFHVHAYRTGHEDLKEKIMLREYLIAHPKVAQDYGLHKLEITNTNPFDNIGYMIGKDTFVKQMLADAHQWKEYAT